MHRSISNAKRLSSALETFVPFRVHASTQFRLSDRTILPQSVNTMYQQKCFKGSSRPNALKPVAPSGYNFQELPADYQRRGQNYSNFMPPEGPVAHRKPYRFNIYWNVSILLGIAYWWFSESTASGKWEHTLDKEHLWASDHIAMYDFKNI